MEYRSPDPEPVIPGVRLDELLLSAASRHDPSAVAIHDIPTGAELTYGELVTQVASVAGAMAHAGIGAGDVVGLHLPNGPESVVCLLATLATGAAVSPLPFGHRADELQHQLRMVDASALITHRDQLGESLRAACALDLEPSSVIVVPTVPRHLSDGPHPGPTSYEQALRHPPTGPTHPVQLDLATAPALLPLSSGTTGLPKPVLLPHRALVANVVQLQAVGGLQSSDRVLAYLPFTHMYGLTATLASGLLAGATLLTMPRFEGAAAVDLIARHRITVMFVVPPVASYLATARAVDDADLSCVRVVVSGGAPLDPAIARTLVERLHVCVLQGYGLTEASPVCLVMRAGAGHSVEGVGIPLPGVRCRVVDPASGRDVPAPREGTVSALGELWVKGPNVMNGYLDRPLETASVLDGEGWLHTGDIASIDDTGQERVVDRLKELITTRGFNVAPAELEAVLQRYPGVADAAVTAVASEAPDDARPWALVERSGGPGGGPSEEGIMRYVADHTADYKHLAGVSFVPRVPRSATGTILRRDLPDLLPPHVTPR